MPSNAFLLALAAGLISALIFVSAATGPAAARFVFYFVTPLPLYLAGLIINPIACAIAGICAASIVLVLSNPVVGYAYGLTTALPAFILCQQALRSQIIEGDRIWFPVGGLVTIAAFFGGAFALFILLLMGGDLETLSSTMRELVSNFVKGNMPQLPSGEPLTEEQITEIADTALKTLPMALGGVSMLGMLLNLWLGGQIANAAGYLKRPWPDLSALELPAGTSVALVIVTALTFVGGMIGLVASGLAGALFLAFAIVGLASTHALSRGAPWRPFGLWAVYLSLIFATLPMLVVLSLVGLAETVFRFRASRNGGGFDPPPDG